MGISIQKHKFRKEFWKILGGEPIIINGNKVYYGVMKGKKFETPLNSYHCAINPNRNEEDFVIIEERWSGKFDEQDIIREFNPNHYK
jgi:mannose-6-phosphate isomerase-like protein (cupin superfamily)